MPAARTGVLEAARQAHLARFEAIVHHSTDVAMFFDADYTIRWVSPAVREVFGLGEAALLGRHGLELIHERDRERVARAFIDELGPNDHLKVEFRIVDGTGRVRWVEEVITDLLGDPAVGFVVGNLRDITDRVDAAEEQIEAALPTDATFARIGNDQFAVLRPGTAELAACFDIVHVIREALSSPFPVDGSDVYVAVCFGVAREPGTSDDQLIRRADMALYRAKQKGPDQVVVFEPALEQGSQDRVQHGAALKRALELGGLVPHYQPVVDLRSGRVVAVEALARWDDPALGPVAPDVFIPVAEATGLIYRLGSQILERACADAVAWLHAGRSLQVAVNVSALQLIDPDFADLVDELLTATGLPARSLTLEITETAALWDLDVAVETLLALDRRGVLLSVDDFGTGYSSLVLLARLPIGAIKIDRSFVAGLRVDERMAHITAGTVALGTVIGSHTVAEGIEHPAQVEALRHMGCEYGQGFLWSPAVPADDVLDVIDRIERTGPAPRLLPTPSA